MQPQELDRALAELAKLDWAGVGGAQGAAAIAGAIETSHGDAPAREALARRLAKFLQSNAGPGAKQFAARRLGEIGGDESVPALAGLLADKDLWGAGCFGLERIGSAAAREALRQHLAKTAGRVKLGVI